jgi:hypothetical protein
MNKPDWKDAPNWAKYLAQDMDWQWGWYENKPRISPYSHTWFWEDGEWQEAIPVAENKEWKETLEPRP